MALSFSEKISKEDLLAFFDKMVKNDLKKLSVQEFSKLALTVPKSTPEIRGYQSELIERENHLRDKNKFIK